MTKTAQQVLLDALNLSQRERATVASGLLESLDPPPPDKGRDHEEWLGEIERRARAALAGTSGVSWEDAKARILKRLDQE